MATRRRRVSDPQVEERQTDLGNAKRLVADHGGSIRYVPAWRSWLVWDGRRWSRDEADTRLMQFAKETIRALYVRAGGIAEDERRGRLVDHARGSENIHRLRAMICLAQSEPSVVVEPAQLDASPWLLNCTNGTLDLRTGGLHPHSPWDLLTKLAPVPYDPEARSDLWEGFQDLVSHGDPDLRDFLQRLAGYTLTGVTREEVFVLLVGGTATGKTTFLEALRAAMGDYARAADFETFLRQSQPRGPRNDIAGLAGARLVTASEAPAGRAFDEAVIKQITGGDKVTARFLHKEFFEYTPQFTVWLATNHRPTVRDDEEAIWRRLLMVPFDATIPEAQRDGTVKEKLRNPTVSGAAILAWAVEGCRKWQAEGLRVADRVRESGQAYRAEMQVFGQFLEDECIEGSEHWVEIGQLRAGYERWALRQGYRFPLGPQRVGEALRARGCVPRKRGGARGWQGLSLIAG